MSISYYIYNFILLFLISFKKLIYHRIGLFMYKVYKDMYPTVITNMYLHNYNIIHSHNTRQKHHFHVAMAGVTMTLFCTHGRVSGPSSLLDLRGHGPPRIQCPMSILTSGPETWPWGPVGWRRSSHDRVSRVPACESSPRAKLESDRY